ncbi:MAG: hypothetical protein NT015_04480 [Alphaproteobacteria bacterium]|nr:hypothetical protein [Alphaproteobacteria bacterium]
MLLAFFVALLQAQAVETIPSPEGRAAALSYVAAMDCAAEFARTSSLARNSVERIPQEAVEQCTEARDFAAQDMLAAIPDTERLLAQNNISARMRVAAADVLIARLEHGDYPGMAAADDPMRAIADPGARLLFCMRTALGRRLESVYFGDNWFVDMRGQTAEQISSAFVQVGRQSCPASESAFQVAYHQVEQTFPRSDRNFLRERLGLEAMQTRAVGPYLSVVPQGSNE